MTTAVVVLTYNRLHLLERCVENVLRRTSDNVQEILVWNNGSTDGTRDYLDSLDLPRLRAVHNEENLGLNAYDPAIQSTTADYIVALDEDVIDAPRDWDAALLDAFQKLPEVGYLAANLVDNPHDVTSQIMYGKHAHLYRVEERNGIRLKVGLVGGWCGLTSRELYTRVGGIGRKRNLTYWHWDGQYMGKLEQAGYQTVILDDLRVTHAGGEYYSETFPEKREFWRFRERRAARRTRVKRVLLSVPFVAGMNERHRWFEPPS